MTTNHQLEEAPIPTSDPAADQDTQPDPESLNSAPSRKRQKTTVVAIAAGGTGGHVFPAIALTEILINRHKITLFTDDRGAKYLNKNNTPAQLQTVILPLNSSARTQLREKIRLIRNFALSTVTAFFTLWRSKANLVVTFGSYISLPVAIAAYLLRIPVIIHEQNTTLGLANRVIAPISQVIATATSQTMGIEPGLASKIKHCGIPVRHSFYNQQKPPKTSLNDINLLIMGGSQGAQILAATVAKIIINLPDEIRNRIHLIHQVPADSLDDIRSLYHDSSLENGQWEVSSFIEDPAKTMAWADLVICRAGATTIAELAMIGRPSLLVPITNSIHNHQRLNAEASVSNGGSIMLLEEQLETELGSILASFFLNDDIAALRLKASNLRQNMLLGTENLAIIIGQMLINNRKS